LLPVLNLSTLVLMSSTTFSPDPAAELLFGKGRRELLALLFGQPEQRYYLRELARITGASAGTTQRELRALVRVGLVSAERRGNQLYFQAHRASPLFTSLRALLEQTVGVADLLRGALAPLAERLEYAGIFGSLARGAHGPSSDVDLLVVGDVEFSEVSDALAEVEKRLDRPVNPTVYTREEFGDRLKERRQFMASVLRGPLIPLIGELRPDARRLAPERVAGKDSRDARGSGSAPGRGRSRAR
jgi:uncharacterized protein